MSQPTTRTRVMALVCGLALTVSLAGCTRNTPPPPEPLTAVPVPLHLTGELAGRTIRLGVLAAPKQGEGSDFRDLAEGVRVATYRFGMTGATIEIVVELDDGTVNGAANAMKDLADQGVIGIIAASAGPHLRQAVTQLDIHPAILLPYENLETTVSDVWTTGPTISMLRQGLTKAMGQAGVSRPYVVTESGQIDLDLNATVAQPFDQVTAAQIAASLTDGTTDSVVIHASAANQARLAVEIQLQIGARQVPIFLTPAALTPAFSHAMNRTGLPASILIAVAANTSDPATLSNEDAAGHLSAFFTAVRLAAADTSCRNIFDDDSFLKASQAADVASHDAAIALIRAAEQANSTSPADVSTALHSMSIDLDAGLAGSALDFRLASAIGLGSVQPLHTSVNDPGLRPEVDAEPLLYWFPTE